MCPTTLCRFYSREKRDRPLSPYGRSHRKRDNESYLSDPVAEFARRSPLEHWDRPPDVPPPKTPSASPGREELVDHYPVAPTQVEAVYEGPPCDTLKSERQNVLEDVSGGPDRLSMLSAGEDSGGRKTEKFEVIAPAFPAVESSATDAPSQHDVLAILSQAHSSSKATASFQNLENLRRKKLKEEQNRIKREERAQRSAGSHDPVSRPTTASRLKPFSASSIILNEGLQSAKKPGTSSLIVSSGKYERGAPISSGDDSEEVDVDTIADDPSTLPISIPLSHLSAPQSEVTTKSSLDSGFHTGASGPSSFPGSQPSDLASKPSTKKRKKKKKDRKKKDKEESVNMTALAQTEGAVGIKMKINLKKKESSLYE